MKTSGLAVRAFVVCATVAALAGCGAAASSVGALETSSQGGMNHARVRSNSGGDLLYVDQGYSLGHNRGVVVIYTYPGNAYVGQFTVSNPSYPPATTEGICSDTQGDVFIEAEYYYGTTIYEYAHGGTSPVASLGDGGNGYANDCASDPTTGNLAVVSRADPDAQGNVAIFADAMGTPTTYTDPGMSNYYSCSYDGQGNLFIEGSTASGEIEFAELPVGSGAFTNITLNKPLKSPGAVQWDGEYITIQEAGTIYRITTSGSTGTVVGTTRILLRSNPSRGYEYIHRNRVIAPDGKQHKAGRIGFWRYPSGGKPLFVYGDDGVVNLYSATISVAPNR